MTAAIRTTPKESVKVPKLSEEERIKQQCIHDVLLLLKRLFESEETTAKLIVDCLYDLGSVNLINNKLRFRPLNRMMKLIARMSKPAFRFVALQWLKKSCPQLITDWLVEQVEFSDASASAAEVLEIPADSLSEGENCSRELRHLRSQVRLLAGSLAVAIAFLVAVSLV